jgi:polyisoprenoid-binding protein YceI
MMVALAAGVASAAQAGGWQGKATVRFQGTSTLHDFRGQGTTDVFGADVVLEGTHAAHVTCAAPLQVIRMSTDNAKRDKSMQAMFHMAEFPALSGAIREVVVDADMPAEAPVTVTIMGKEQQVESEIMNASVTESGIHFQVHMDVSLKASGLRPPSVMGVIRVGDIVHVSADVDLKQPTAGE